MTSRDISHLFAIMLAFAAMALVFIALICWNYGRREREYEEGVDERG
jgi:cbb3-type cytochrome oxidase subunit 3